MRNEILRGTKHAIPIMLGYLPLGMAFGILATQQGFSIFEIFFMSLTVFAGSAQYIGASMISSGAAGVAVVATTFLVNLRHLLMSASLSPYLKHVSTPKQILIAATITDETYASDITEAQNGTKSPYFYIGLNTFSHLSWILSTVLGGIIGNLISDPTKLGLDFALAAMFIGLLILQVDSKKSILVAVISGIISLFVANISKGNFNIIIATVLAATLGVCIEKWTKK